MPLHRESELEYSELQQDGDVPATEFSSVSLNWKKSIANRADSGKGDLLDGGVGSDADGAGDATRAANDNEPGPSAYC